jgi:hypothetical protein
MMKRTLGALLVWMISGCSATTDWNAIYTEYFENLCDDTPCGWTQSGGPSDAVRFVTTAAGARGLEVTGDDVRLRAEGMDRPNAYRGFASVVTARLVARCDTGSVLELRASLELSDGSIITLGSEFAPDDRWQPPMDQPLLAQDGELSDLTALERVLALQILKKGPGTCEINALVLRAI